MKSSESTSASNSVHLCNTIGSTRNVSATEFPDMMMRESRPIGSTLFAHHRFASKPHVCTYTQCYGARGECLGTSVHNIFSRHYSICVLVANDWPFFVGYQSTISTACLFREPSMSDCLVSVERKQRQNNEGK